VDKIPAARSAASRGPPRAVKPPCIQKGVTMASANVLEFTSQNWQKEVVESNLPVLVDFWAPWCGPCRMLSPTIDRLADQFAGRVKVGKLNIDNNQDIAASFGVTSIPRVFIFKGGSQPVAQFVGVQRESDLSAALNRALEK
jgi:thioredoxin 1